MYILRDKELMKKLLFIFLSMIFIRIGSVFPLPFIDTSVVKDFFNNSGFGFLNLITGNSLSQMSFFALSISPYITASIIIQLLTVSIKRLEELSKDGKTGQDKIQMITNVIAIIFAFAQSIGLAIGFGKQGMLRPFTWYTVLLCVFIWTIGSGILIYIGEKITKFNLGNGISYILLLNILSVFPNDILSLKEVFIDNKILSVKILNGFVIAIILILLIYSCIFLSTTEKRIPMIFSRKVNGFTNKNYLPIPLNTCGVMPIIFSSSVMSLPIIIGMFINNNILTTINQYFNQSNWFDFHNLKYTLGAIVYIGLTYLFTLFYLEINFNVYEISQNLKMQGATIAGIRQGNLTSEYLGKITRKLALIGTTISLLIIISIMVLTHSFGISSLSIGGTSILICVAIILESKKAIQTEFDSAKNRSYINSQKSLFGTSLKGGSNV